MKPSATFNPLFGDPGQKSSLAGHFNVYRRDNFSPVSVSSPLDRRDFYKIWLITEGSGSLHLTGQTINVQAPALIFFNPAFSFSWEPDEGLHRGFLCLFSEYFFSSSSGTENLSTSVLFNVAANPVCFPDAQSTELLSSVFEYMIREMRSVYPHKYDLLRSYVEIVMHEALKTFPAEGYVVSSQASRRICNMFMELLERQFPLHHPTETVPFRSAQDFARALDIHPNHLNKSLKEITGKTTTDWIAERLTREAGALLRHSNWDIAGIAWALGFEHPSNFTLFFKKATGESPKAFRQRHQTMLVPGN